MTARTPLVVGGDGLPQQLQSGDTLAAFETFAQSRWVHNDMDIISSNGFSGFQINSGVFGYVMDMTANVYGIVNISSSTTASSGCYVLANSNATPNLKVGNIYRCIFQIPANNATATINLGWMSPATTPSATSGAFVVISGVTAQAKVISSSGGTTTASSSTLSTGVWMVLDIEWTSATTCRFCIFDLASNTKYYDQTITVSNSILTTGGAYNPQGYSGVVALSSGTTVLELIRIDYIGRGLARPAAIVTPS